jgi:hypothetical protein
MSNLNPNIPSPELSRLLTQAAAQMSDYGLRLLTPQLLLRVFLEDDEAAAYHILQTLSQQKGFKLVELVNRVDMMTRHSPRS